MSNYWKKKLEELEQSNSPSKSTTKSATKSDYWGSKLTELEKAEDIAPVSKPKVQTTTTKIVGVKTEKKDDKEAFWGWLGNSAMSGVAGFNKGLTSAADLILGKPLQALGWENNPISNAAEYYSDEYDIYKNKATTLAKQLGGDKNIAGMGNGYQIAGEIVEGTVGAIPMAVEALATGGTSMADDLATAFTFRNGNLLQKAGLTVEKMMEKPSYWLSFAQTYGNDYEEAVKSGVDENVAMYTSMLSSLINAGIEIGIDGASGIQGLPKKALKGDKSALMEWVQSSLEEGGEEVLQGVVSRGINDLSNGADGYIEWDEDTKIRQNEVKVFDLEQMLKEGLMGTAVGGILGGGQIGVQSSVNAVQQAQANKLTADEQAVVDKVVETRITEEELAGKPVTASEKRAIEKQVREELEKGRISIDTIEEVLGGDSYKTYKDAVDSEDKQIWELDRQIKELESAQNTVGNSKKYDALTAQLDELKANSQRDQLKAQLSGEVFGKAQNTRLAESYNERARRGQTFEADISKYDAKQQKVIQNAIDSGILNNTRRAHEFVDMIAKISADKGVSFDFTDNERLKTSGFAVDGAVVNGYVNDAGDITLNINSSKATRAVVGHEITHILEGTALYEELQNVIEEYATSRGEYESRLEALTKLYKGKKGYETDFNAKVRAELTADLVGDYLFDDADFINNLSTKHRNVFQKIYDEIKYLCKVATAGSAEARELEKVKKAFEDAYRADNKASGDTKYSLTDNTGKELSKTDETYAVAVKNRDWDTAQKMVDEAAEKAGYTRVVYHGTEARFTVFDTDEESTNRATHTWAADYPDGTIFLAESEDVAGYYGDNIMPLLLDTTDVKVFEEPDMYAHQAMDDKYGYEVYNYPVIAVKGKDMTIYATLDNTAVKSALAAQYDDNGELIPLSQRFKHDNPDIRYSLSEDSKGRKLSKEQQDFFADSKIRVSEVDGWANTITENGALLPVYHGTNSGEFYEFDKSTQGSANDYGWFGKGFYFAFTEGEASYYGRRVLECYLNVKNPFVYDDEMGTFDGQSRGDTDFDFAAFIVNMADKFPDIAQNTFVGVAEHGSNEVVKKSFADFANEIRELYVDNRLKVVEIDDGGKTIYQYKYSSDVDSIDAPERIKEVIKENYIDSEWSANWALEKGRITEADYDEIISLFDKYGEEQFDDAWLHIRYNSKEQAENSRLSAVVRYLSERRYSYIDQHMPHYYMNSVVANAFSEELRKRGYDGVLQSRYGDEVVVFDPNQIKLTSNKNPTSSPDMRYSLSYEGETHRYRGDAPMSDLRYEAPVQETVPVEDAPIADNAIPDNFAPATEEDVAAMAEESFAALEDADAPPMREITYDDMPDTTAIGDTALKRIAKSVRDSLALNSREGKAIQEVIQKYSTTELPSRDALAAEIRDKFGERTWIERDEELAEVKNAIRKAPIAVSQTVKNDITDYTAFMRSNFGKVRFSKNGLPVDTAYMELAELYPAYFPKAITNESDMLKQIVYVANEDVNTDNSYELSDADIYKAVDIISAEVSKYKTELLQKAVETEGRNAFWDLRGVDPLADETTDIFEEDIAPTKAVDRTEPIRSVEERLAAKLQNAEAELAKNKQLRQESWVSFDEEIERLKAEYNSKKNKDTKAANDILQRIERMRMNRSNVDADYAKRISDLAERINKMNSPVYKRAEQRMAKHEEYTTQMENLVGDTSTWVDKKLGISYKTNTLRRNLRDIVRDANGNRDIAKADAIYEELQGKYNHNEALLNKEATRIKQPYAEMEITKAEDAYIQMLGELRHNPETTLTEDAVLDYYNKHKKDIDKAKVDKAIAAARETYDSLLNRVNAVLKEQGMKEIPYRKGYFPHFTDPKQGFLAKLFNWKTKDFDIPTDIAGLTEQFNPNRSWQSFNKERKSDTTDYSFTKGMDTYVQGALDWIYHIEDIQKRRAFENHIRFVHSDEGIKERINKIRKNEEYDADEMQEQIDLVYKEARNPLNNFVTDLRAGTNTLAGKKSSLDRGMEEMVNRKAYSTMTNLSNRVTGNMVVGSVSSALTNFIPITQSWAEVSPLKSLRAMGDTIRSTLRDDGTIAKSDFLTNRLRKADNLYKTGWDKVADKATFLMEGIDSFTSQVVWRSKYLDNISHGMSENAAIKNADQFADSVIAGRSRGNMPTIFDSKNPLIKTLTAFQLEVNNQYGYMFKDVPQDVKDKSVARLVTGYAAMFFGAYAYNALYSSLTGRDAAFDPIRIIENLLAGIFDDDEEKEPTEIAVDFAEDVLQEIPFVGGMLGGGRIPISAAMPYDGVWDAITGTAQDVADKDYANLTKEWLNPLYYLAMPMGGGQIKKTVEGLSMFSDEHPVSGSYTTSGNMRFPVEKTFGNVLQAGLFGQYSSKNAREYFDNDYASLGEKQIAEYAELDLPIKDYWEYRDGLKGLDSTSEKLDYIDSLDLPIDKKSILAYNIATDNKDIANAKDAIKRYGDFQVGENHASVGGVHYRWYEQDDGKAGWRKLSQDELAKQNEVTKALGITPEQYWGNKAEYDMKYKYPEKYAVLQEQGISVEEYKEKYEDSAFIYTDDFSWAADNPSKYAISKAVAGDVIQYRKYTSELSAIEADKDENGKSISGSRKEKVLDYINGMDDLDYGQKIILYRSMYSSKDDKAYYNAEIVDYLNSRDDISYDEMVTILEELDMTVDSNGNIYW